ncbi:MAG: GatB/YqeY domain-containing protein [Bacteroidales bacterium]|nr:GatB/YqeY domain-containing protein [Bacteroidales bacterium]
MSIFEKINDDIKKAMIAKEKEKLEALRAVKAAFLLAKTETADSDLSEEKEIQIVQKLVKQRRDAAEIYKQQNRQDLYEPEVYQADVISAYLPEQMSEEEIANLVKAIIVELNADSMNEMGKVMAAANAKLAGKADGKTISILVKSMLSS